MQIKRYLPVFLLSCSFTLSLTACGSAAQTLPKTVAELNAAAVTDYQLETRTLNRWNGGYQGVVNLTNKTSNAPATSFQLELSFLQNVTLAGLWGGATKATGRSYHVTSPAHFDLKKGDTHEIGFVVQGSQTPAQAGLLSVSAPAGSPSPAPKPAPAANNPFYVNPSSAAALWAENNAADPRAALIRRKIADQPEGKWVGDWTPDLEQEVSAYTKAAAAAGKTPIFVAYNIPGRDCGQYSSGGAGSPAAYKSWIRSLVRGVAQRSAVVILEPDALPLLLDCQQGTNTKLLSFAVAEFSRGAPNAKVYLDAGNSAWKPAAEMAARLKAANIAKAAGFALNTSNYRTTAESKRYGDAIVKLLGSKTRFVIDTSRNGAGPGNDWCNPAGRKLGVTSRKVAGNTGLAMLLWVKAPGESDGDCGVGQGSAAGEFLPQVAFDMAK